MQLDDYLPFQSEIDISFIIMHNRIVLGNPLGLTRLFSDK